VKSEALENSKVSKGVVPQVNFMHRRVDFHVKEETLSLRNSSGTELTYDKFITLTEGGILAVACTKENWTDIYKVIWKPD
jgi:hypothetical protein